MKRREFITLLGGAAAHGRSRRARSSGDAGDRRSSAARSIRELTARLAAAFRQGLSEPATSRARTCAIEYRWADGDNDRLPALAAELVRRQVAVIVATGSTAAALAAKAATTTIPIVFVIGDDPVRLGLVASLDPAGRQRHRRRPFSSFRAWRQSGWSCYASSFHAPPASAVLVEPDQS